MKRNKVLFIGAILASAIVSLIFYRLFLIPLGYVFGPITGFEGLPVSDFLILRLAVFDFAFVCFLALFLSILFDWKTTLRYWAYGYLLLIVASLIEAGIYIPDPLRLLFILVSASVGFLIGQGFRFILLRVMRQNSFISKPTTERQNWAGIVQFNILAKGELKIFFLSAVVSVAFGLIFHKQLFTIFDYFLQLLGGGFYTLDSAPYSSVQLINATLDLSFSLFLAVLLSLFLSWRKTMKFWLLGYIAFVAMSAVFYNGIFTPDRLSLPSILIFGVIGLLVGKSIHFLLVRAKMVT